MSAPVLNVENLNYGFRGKTVGRGFTFALHENEVMAVLGPNGAGKTTLFRTLHGLLPPHAGEIKLMGKPLREYSQAEMARTLTYVPQAHDSYFPFAARDVVLMGRTAHLRIFASPGPKDREIANDALKQLRIEHLADRPFDELSGGEQQLILIARALATEARVSILDEPTANLDYGNQLMVLAEIGRLKEAGKSVLFCTHHPEHARRYADTAILIQGGASSAAQRVIEAVTQTSIARLYGLDLPATPAHTELVSSIEQIGDDLSKLLDSAHAKHGEVGKVGTALILTSIELFFASMTLLKSRTPSHALTLLRSMVEADADITLLSTNPGHLKQLQWKAADQFIETYENFRDDPEVKAEGLFDAQQLSQLETAKQMRQMLEKGVDKRQSIRGKFKLAEQEDLYKTTYAFLCSSTHNSLTDLSARHVRAEKLVIFEKMKPEMLYTASGLALSLLISSAKKLPYFTTLSGVAVVDATDRANSLLMLAQEGYIERTREQS